MQPRQLTAKGEETISQAGAILGLKHHAESTRPELKVKTAPKFPRRVKLSFFPPPKALVTKQNLARPSFTLDQQGSLAAPWVSPGQAVPGWLCRGSSHRRSLPGQGTGWQRLLWAGAQTQPCRKRAKVLWCSQRGHVAVPPHRQRIPDLSQPGPVPASRDSKATELMRHPPQ